MRQKGTRQLLISQRREGVGRGQGGCWDWVQDGRLTCASHCKHEGGRRRHSQRYCGSRTSTTELRKMSRYLALPILKTHPLPQ